MAQIKTREREIKESGKRTRRSKYTRGNTMQVKKVRSRRTKNKMRTRKKVEHEKA
jgi:hypothetical protein